MPTTPRSQMALAADANFLRRLASLMVSEAQVVAAVPAPPVDPPEPYAAWQKRKQLAYTVINNPTNMTAQLAPTITNSTNLVAATTSYNFEAGATETSAIDDQIRSQIATLWSVMAGV